MTVGEILRVVVDHGMWGLGMGSILILARSRPIRELGRIVAIELRWRYLKWKGVPDHDLQRLLRNGWNDDGPKSEPPATV